MATSATATAAATASTVGGAGGGAGASSLKPTNDAAVEKGGSKTAELSPLKLGLAKERVLAVGLACIDNVIPVSEYPAEDTDHRCFAPHKARGGNATNSLNIVAQCGLQAWWIGTCALDSAEGSDFVRSTLARERINDSLRVPCKDGYTPTSWIMTSKATGSRTILHHRDLRELSCSDFFRQVCTSKDCTDDEVGAALRQWSWIHFEGRNIADTVEILQRLRRVRAQACGVSTDASKAVSWHQWRALGWPVLSVELEKTIPKIEVDLAPLGDVVFMSKEFAEHHGGSTAAEGLQFLRATTTAGALLVCPWSELGAWALDTRIGTAATLHEAPAVPPKDGVVDTIGAGDSFIGAAISALLAGASVDAMLRFSCLLAGLKCGQSGFDGVVPNNRKALAALLR